ncbi:hypothetical protein AGMMS49975_16670 [Clostridia bacterium]|nr:hypothetical protein AGMMS49975_16670 [Clostridia bacterium]
MRFFVERTSEHNNRNPLANSARMVTTVNGRDKYDVRTCDEETYNTKFNRKWRSCGKDHCVLENGSIQRTVKSERDEYAITISSLGDLLEFIREVGCEVIINLDNPQPTLEIYDGYRE